MTLSAAVPFANMEAAFGRLRNSGRPIVVASMIVDGMATDRVIQPTPTRIEGSISQYLKSGVQIGAGVGCWPSQTARTEVSL